MSTFGRKALIWWNYDDVDKTRFTHTPDDMQLKLLEKWYPIGSMCQERPRIVNFKSEKYNWEITGYTKMLYGYCIDVEFGKMKKHSHPFRLNLSPNDLKTIKREAKLEKLGF